MSRWEYKVTTEHCPFWNEAIYFLRDVEYSAKGDILQISKSKIRHPFASLDKMKEELESMLAAVDSIIEGNSQILKEEEIHECA